MRGRDGDTRFWPLAENTHRDGILRISRVPAAGAPQQEAESLVARLLDDLGYVGVIALELFSVPAACSPTSSRRVSTQHGSLDDRRRSDEPVDDLRAILGLPLGHTDVLVVSVMINLVGGIPARSPDCRELPGLHVHLYGKDPRPGRKLSDGFAHEFILCQNTTVGNAVNIQLLLCVDSRFL